MNESNMKGKKVLIVGLGKSGKAALTAMLEIGAKVYVQDSRENVKFDPNFVSYLNEKCEEVYLGEDPKDLAIFDMVILSPGVSPELSFVQKAKENGAEITGELEIAYRISEGNFVAITGTNGKTTTTTLTGDIFKAAGRKTYVVGNIGTAVISASGEAEINDWLVTECSSFQLETTKYFKPVVSAITNLTPDHLNRHHTMEAYGQAKAKIFANQSEDGYLVINYDDKLCYSLAEGAKCKIVPFSRKEILDFGAYVKDGKIIVNDGSAEHVICETSELKIIGDHNVENVLTAAAVSFFAGIGEDVIGETVRKFPGVEHRIEYCGNVDGVLYYNDSKGTNTDAAETALRALKKNIILIAGGDSKGQEFDDFVKSFEGKVKQLLILGRDGHFIAEACDRQGFTDYRYCKDIPDCVKTASEIAGPGDFVLLSPACASWDMYENYEQRGRHFKECVASLSK